MDTSGKVNRRRFLKYVVMSSAGLVLVNSVDLPGLSGGKGFLRVPRAYASYQSTPLSKFTEVLRGVGPDGIQVAVPDATKAPVTGVTHYTMEINQYQDRLHSSMGPTTLWGYNPTRALGVNPVGPGTQRHLSGIIIAKKGVPLQITFRNNLPTSHILPVDTTIMGAEEDQAQNRTAVHLHGGLVPWISDGGPFAWWDPQDNKGASFVQNTILNPGAAANEAEYYYPMNQSARLLWYHDHAVGITRLNAYAGIASALLIRDDFEASLVNNKGLPAYIEDGGRELPIAIQDKIFVGDNIAGQDPTWPSNLPQDKGSLWYPHEYDAEVSGGTPPVLSVVPEMFGDTMLANGTVYPRAQVEPRRYRLRILNACQARFLNLQLRVLDAGSTRIQFDKLGTPNNTTLSGPDWVVIGTEGGFLAYTTVVPSGQPFSITGEDYSTIKSSLLTGPAERWDVIVDFSAFAGKKIVLYNDAPAPFPMGGDDTDFYSNSDVGPDTRQIMRFDVGTTVTAPADPPLKIVSGTNMTAGIDPPIAPGGWSLTAKRNMSGLKTRTLTLNEGFDEYGRLIQMLGTNSQPAQPEGNTDYGRAYTDAPTEVVKAGSTEVWRICNLTGDTHPMHFHLVNVQVLSRQPLADVDNPFDVKGNPITSGTARGPDATEVGWKETVKMHPGEVTTVIMKFSLPSVPFAVPNSPRLQQTYNLKGAEYVWHCHILEHEEHDMMRPLVVQ